MSSDLSPREALFVAEFIIDGIGRQAAIRAGYSAQAAAQQASRLLTKANVKAAVKAALKEQEKRTLVTADQVLKRIDRVARKAEASGDFSAANQANKLLGQHYKLFTEKHEHGGMGGGPVQFQILPAEVDH